MVLTLAPGVGLSLGSRDGFKCAGSTECREPEAGLRESVEVLDRRSGFQDHVVQSVRYAEAPGSVIYVKTQDNLSYMPRDSMRNPTVR